MTTTEMTVETTPEIRRRSYVMGGRIPAFMGLAQRTGGVYVENPPTIAEALKQTGLDFEVKMEGVQATYEDIEIGPDGPRTVVRTAEMPHLRSMVAHFDDGRPPVGFQTGSPSYTPVQNRDGLAFGQHIVDGGDGELVAIGAHGNPMGARTYAAFALTEGMTIGGQDRHDLYLTIINSHDKSSGLTALLAPIRLACTNQTYATFKGKAVPKFTIRHTSGANLRAAEARQALQMAWSYRDTYVAEAEELLAVSQSKDQFLDYAHHVFGDKDPENQTDRSKTIVRLRDEQLLEILAGATNEFGRGTAYAGYQTVVEYVDFFSTVRGAHPEQKRQERIVAGQLDTIKDRAWNLATV